jgi:hypothetical protein
MGVGSLAMHFLGLKARHIAGTTQRRVQAAIMAAARDGGGLESSNVPLLFALGILIEGAEDSECHGLDAGFDGRFRHRREQWRMVGG